MRMQSPPHAYKCEVVTRHGIDFDCLVETGTYNGDMVWAQRDQFSTIHSIELGDELFSRAKNRFAHLDHVKIYHGSSPDILKKLMPDLPPSIFWLDAHFSGGNTALGDTPCPLLDELDVIRGPHAILIDDARCFGRLKGFPTLDQIEGKIGQFEIVNDIIFKDLRT